MGYNVQIESGTIKIPTGYLDSAYNTMCELNHLPDDDKAGGSWKGGQRNFAWFSWMDWNYPETCVNAQEILAQLGFYDTYEWDGNLVIHAYDSKKGQEELFIAAIAPWITPDSVLHWVGEDGNRWRWTFVEGELIHQWGQVVYTN